MGTVSRESPKYLAQKLLKIRKTLDGGLSQEEIVKRLRVVKLNRTYISKYETGVLEPPLKVLLRYADLAGVYLEVLANDELELPEELPCVRKSEGIKRQRAAKKR
jgi:transcriptional regulator with XRE-family HTH domain